jgi:hypothetical protein
LVETLRDSFFDIIRVVPLLFLTSLLSDLFMRKANSDNKLIDRFTKYDYLGGSLLGIIPQCGIPVVMANLYSSGYITLGMLIAVFLSSSDEALILIGAHPEKLLFVVGLILFKILIAIAAGFLVNSLVKEKRNRIKACSADCTCPKCRKYIKLWINSLVYTAKLTLYLFITVFIINYGLDKLGQDSFEIIIGKSSYFQPVLAAFIGMVPSCASSVVLAEAFIKGAISLGALVSGLCANTGFGILVVLKELPLKKSIKIILILQLISILSGELILIFGR